MKVTHQSPASTTTLLRKSLTLVTVLVLALVPSLAKADAPSSGVPFTQALADANRVTAMHNGWKVFMVKGQSMEPQFGSSSLLLLAETKYEALKPGMLVIYKDASGDLVSHRLMAQTDAGWVVKGLNNEKADPGLVTKDNLQGVVFGILNYKSGTDAQLVATNDAKPTLAYAKKY